MPAIDPFAVSLLNAESSFNNIADALLVVLVNGMNVKSGCSSTDACTADSTSSKSLLSVSIWLRLNSTETLSP